MPPMAFQGLVTKVGFMNKTATVTITRWIVHRKTGKRLERSTKLLAHDESNQLRLNDTVVVRNCPPISARKRFTLERVVHSPEREREAMHARMAAEAKAKEALAGQGQHSAESSSPDKAIPPHIPSGSEGPTAHAS